MSDRFYNMYYLLRFSPVGRVRLERLVDFLHQLYGPIGMWRTYEAALDALLEVAWSRVTELSRPDDPAELTNLRWAAVVRQGVAQLRRGNVAEAYALKPIAEGPPDGVPQQRHSQAAALVGAALAGAESGRA